MHKTPSTLPAVAKPETALRINRFLAAAGLGSRRSCEEHILEGRVSINGSFCRNLATRVTPEDDVRVNGKQIQQGNFATPWEAALWNARNIKKEQAAAETAEATATIP